MTNPRIRHRYHGTCQHWRCCEASGWQCAECGHYFAREEVRMDPDSEVRCRTGKGHERNQEEGQK